MVGIWRSSYALEPLTHVDYWLNWRRRGGFVDDTPGAQHELNVQQPGGAFTKHLDADPQPSSLGERMLGGRIANPFFANNLFESIGIYFEIEARSTILYATRRPASCSHDYPVLTTSEFPPQRRYFDVKDNHWLSVSRAIIVISSRGHHGILICIATKSYEQPGLRRCWASICNLPHSYSCLRDPQS